MSTKTDHFLSQTHTSRMSPVNITFLVNQISASDLLPFVSCSLMSIFFRKENKSSNVTWGSLSYWSVWPKLWWGQLLGNLYAYKNYLPFFNTGLGHTTKRVNSSYPLMSAHNGRKYERNGNQNHEEMKCKCVLNAVPVLLPRVGLPHAGFCAQVLEDTQRLIMQYDV